MKKWVCFFFASGLIGILWSSCGRESPPTNQGFISIVPVLPVIGYDYNEKGILTAFEAKTINNHLAQLGRVIFYDKTLSVDNSMSCGTCHQQEHAFSDGVALSSGYSGIKATRNTRPLFNLPYEGWHFWDLRTKYLGWILLDPFQHKFETGIDDPEKISKKILATPYYQVLLYKAFGTKIIDGQDVSEALAEFLGSLIATSSRFDEVFMKVGNGFTEQETRGYSIFKENCISCHGGINFNNQVFFNGNTHISSTWLHIPGRENVSFLASDFANIGLDLYYLDQGMSPALQMEVKLDNVGQGLFKIPSLRNVAITGPYMHDGRFSRLLDVIDHYDHGIASHPNLDPRLQEYILIPPYIEPVPTGNPIRMHLSPEDKDALIAFLNTLTDRILTTHPRFSDPFRMN